MHLAQLNVGTLLHPQDDPRVAGFMDNLDLVNGIAERSPGFVWRLQDESGNATSIQAFEDPELLVNLSVWETPEALEKFVWQTVHKQFYARRAEWFEVMDKMHVVMWWVEPGAMPTAHEARERLEHLWANGPGDYAFGWESLPNVKMWKEARCA